MEQQSTEYKDCLIQLKEVDEQLAYLALLTCCGVKPLSRWEKPLTQECVTLLTQMNLYTASILRSVKIGRKITETIFSTLKSYLDIYKSRFHQTPVDKSSETVRFEGYLFGFPPCCVDAFVKQPYVQNHLPEEDQKILFHWACPNCQITPYLLPSYRQLHDFLTKC